MAEKEDMSEVRLFPTGSRFINGLSSSYDCESYPDKLQGVITEEELHQIMNRLNDTIISYWPCHPCLIFAYICAPCAICPCFPPNICVAEAEKHAHHMLEQVSLRSRYYDQRISFHLIKKCCTSYISIVFPKVKPESASLLSNDKVLLIPAVAVSGDERSDLEAPLLVSHMKNR